MTAHRPATKLTVLLDDNLGLVNLTLIERLLKAVGLHPIRSNGKAVTATEAIHVAR